MVHCSKAAVGAATNWIQNISAKTGKNLEFDTLHVVFRADRLEFCNTLKHKYPSFKLLKFETTITVSKTDAAT